VSSTGVSEIAFLSGPPGIGKSALVRRFQSLIRVGRHRFAEGKSEHSQNGAILAPVAQALLSLVDGVLGESDEALAALRARLREAVGNGGRLINDLVDEAKVLFGDLPILPELPAALAQARLQRALLGTFSAFASAQQPLVLFIDDLQWGDPASLAFFAAFAADPPANILLVGSYRLEGADRLEAEDGLVSRIRSAAIGHSEISLAPLDLGATEELLAYVLKEESADLAPLAGVIHAQALGNPFFIEHFLRRLLEDAILWRDPGSGQWAWDGARLQGLAGSGDVLDFIAGRIARLEPAQREVMASLAAFGGHADAGLIASLVGRDTASIESLTEELMSVGLLLSNGAELGFAHDRVLEASELLTPTEHQPGLHARIARLLLVKGQDRTAGQVFALAGHVLRAVGGDGPALLKPGSRLRFAAVLRDAAQQARLAASPEQASLYLDAAARIAEDGWWSTDPRLAFDIAYLRSDSLLLRGKVALAETSILTMLTRKLRDRDRASAYRLLAALRTVQSDYEGAISAALAGLALMGMSLERAPSREACRAVVDRVSALMGDRPDAEIANLPLAEDPDIALITSLLSKLIVCIFTGDDLRILHLAKIVELTLTHGVTADSANGMAWYGVMISDFYGRFQDGFAYGEAALALIDRHGFEGQRTATLVAVDQLSPWTHSFEHALARVHHAIDAGHAAGDVAMTCFARNHLVSDLLQMGRPLIQVEAEAERGLELTRRVNFRDIEILIGAQLSLVRRLRNGAVDAPYEELGDINSASTRFWVRLYDGIGAFMFDDFDRAAKVFAEAEPLCWGLPAHIDLVYYALFAALNSARHLPAPEALAAMQPHRERLAEWAPLNPPMFRHKLLLVEAEMERLRSGGLEALRLYDLAIQAAGAFVHERGLARDLAGRYCAELGLDGLARHYFDEAAVDFRLWGAVAKAKRIPLPDTADKDGAVVHDLLQAMQAIQEITSETDLKALRVQVLHALMTHADADRGKLILIHDGDPVIEAEGARTGDQISISVATAMPTPDRVPPGLLASIIRTPEPLLKDVLTRTDDPIAFNGMRTILALPLLFADRVVGVAYLEANPERFNRRLRRLPILRLLSVQSAICLERAQWHATTYENFERRAHAESALRAARAELAQTSHLATMGGLAASISHEINQPLSAIVSYASAGTRWLKRAEPNVGEALQNLDDIRLAGRRASEIVAALRSLAKQDNLQREPLDLNAVIRDVLELTQPEIEIRQVRVEAAVSDLESLVSGDRVQLQQLVLNLVNNAIDAMEGTAVDQRLLVISSVERGGQLLTRVEDRGCGIPKEALEKIFTPLFSTKSKGMGMGLAICKSIVEAHGGELSAGAAAAGGTFFEFTVPRAKSV